MKFLERGAGVNKSVLREILNHRLCVVHPNIVQFREIFLTPVHLAIVMEFAAGGDMFEYVIKHKMPQHGQGLVENSARAFFQQLIIALDFCHELGIANRCASCFVFPMHCPRNWISRYTMPSCLHACVLVLTADFTEITCEEGAISQMLV